MSNEIKQKSKIKLHKPLNKFQKVLYNIIKLPYRIVLFILELIALIISSIFCVLYKGLDFIFGHLVKTVYIRSVTQWVIIDALLSGKILDIYAKALRVKNTDEKLKENIKKINLDHLNRIKTKLNELKGNDE